MGVSRHIKVRQRRRKPPQVVASAWVRGLAVLFALLFATVNTAEAAHLHRPVGQEHHLQAPAAGTPGADAEEHCPLCIASHPALPAPIQIAPAPLLVVASSARLTPDRHVSAAWAFARFGRPPPEQI